MKSLTDLANEFSHKAAAIKQLENTFPSAIGKVCTDEIKHNFTKMQGVWPKRSPSTDKAYEYNRTDDYRTPKLGKVSRYVNPYGGSVVHADRPILVQTGNLRDSITFNVSGKQVIIGVFHKMSKLGHDSLQYAKLLNEGGPMKAWGKHSTTMPRRKFMPFENEGPTETMIKKARTKYKQELDAIMSNWKK